MRKAASPADLESGKPINYKKRPFVMNLSPAQCRDCGAVVYTHRLAGSKLPAGWTIVKERGRVVAFQCPRCSQPDEHPMDSYERGVDVQ